jgi:hypothetical protein
MYFTYKCVSKHTIAQLNRGKFFIPFYPLRISLKPVATAYSSLEWPSCVSIEEQILEVRYYPFFHLRNKRRIPTPYFPYSGASTDFLAEQLDDSASLPPKTTTRHDPVSVPSIHPHYPQVFLSL